MQQNPFLILLLFSDSEVFLVFRKIIRNMEMIYYAVQIAFCQAVYYNIRMNNGREGETMYRKNLLILGAGQYGQVVRETAIAMDCFGKVDFLDDNSPAAIGKMQDYKKFEGSYACAFVAVGNPQLRMKWIGELDGSQFEIPVLIHPRAYVSPSATLHRGTIVEPMAVVNAHAQLETGVLVCAGAVVNHNAHVHSLCQIDCNGVVAANAVVPVGTKVPCGTVFDRK